MSCLSFSNNYFDEAIITVQESFTRDTRNIYLKNSLEGCYGNLNLLYIGKSEKEKRKDCLLILGYEIIISGTFL